MPGSPGSCAGWPRDPRTSGSSSGTSSGADGGGGLPPGRRAAARSGDGPERRGRERGWIPPLGHRWLTPFYDPVLRWALREHRFKSDLLERARLGAALPSDGGPTLRVLDLGCGTGTLTRMVARRVSGRKPIGVDVDPGALSRARRKSEDLILVRAAAGRLPFPDDHFDRVLASLVLHHLVTAEKVRALRETRRVLRPGGRLHVADFGAPGSGIRGLLIRAAHFLFVRLLDGLEPTADHAAGRLPALVERAGFRRARRTGSRVTVAGRIVLLTAEA